VTLATIASSLDRGVRRRIMTGRTVVML
jgi:hypothetical protein